METKVIFEGLKGLGMRVAYVEDITKSIVLADTHTNAEVEQIEQWLEENGYSGYSIVNPQPVETAETST